MTGHRIKIGKARITPLGKIEPKKTWSRAKDHRKAAREAAAWLKKSKPTAASAPSASKRPGGKIQRLFGVF